MMKSLPQCPSIQELGLRALGYFEDRIGCGDGRDTAFLRHLVGKRGTVNAAYMDPPYNEKTSSLANLKSRHREFAVASGEMSDEASRALLKATLGTVASISRDRANCLGVMAATAPMYRAQ